MNHVCGLQNLSKPRLQILVEGQFKTQSIFYLILILILINCNQLGVSQELEGCLNKLYQIKAIYYDIQTDDCDDEDGHQIGKVENNFEDIFLDKKEEQEDDEKTGKLQINYKSIIIN